MKYEAILSYLDDYKLVSNNEEVRFNCPFCGDTRKRLYLNLNTGRYYCHNCNSKASNPIKLVSELSGMSMSDLHKEFKDLFSEAIVSRKSVLDTINEKLVISKEILDDDDYLFKHEEKDILPTGFRPLRLTDRKPLSYLKKRGFTAKQIFKLGAGLCKDKRYYGRIIIPIEDLEDKVVFYVARDFTGNSNLKELSCKDSEVTKSQVIWNINQAVQTGTLVISEGIFDAMSWGKSGVALLGKAYSTEQLELLHRVKDSIDEVYVALDEDAIDNSYKLATDLRSLGYEDIYIVPFKGDPNDNLIKTGKLGMGKLLMNSIKFEGKLSRLR